MKKPLKEIFYGMKSDGGLIEIRTGHSGQIRMSFQTTSPDSSGAFRCNALIPLYINDNSIQIKSEIVPSCFELTSH